MGRVFSTGCRSIATHLIMNADLSRTVAHIGAVPLIQHVGSALNISGPVLLVLDTVHVGQTQDYLEFRSVHEPTSAQLTEVTVTLTARVGCHLEGEIVLKHETSYPVDDELEVGGLGSLPGSSLACQRASTCNAVARGSPAANPRG